VPTIVRDETNGFLSLRTTEEAAAMTTASLSEDKQSQLYHFYNSNFG